MLEERALTEEDRRLRDTPCESRDELNEWLKYHLGIYIPDCLVDVENSNISPFDMVWKIYESALYTQELTNALFIGNRGGSKTFNAAVVEFLLLQHDHRSVTHIGAIEKQAKRAYQYFQDFYRNPNFKEFIDKLVMEKTIVKGRGTLEILPCTLASVNGPHTPLVVRDEIDTVQDMQAYKDIKGIPIQMPDGRPPIEIGISTRKSSFGLVQQEVNNAKKTGLQVFIWGILETCRRCPEERSGVDRVPLYVNVDRLETLAEEEWKILPFKIQGEYTKYIGYEGCRTRCKMFSACRGLLKNQKCNSPYLRSIDFVQKQLFESSEDWTNAQHLCRKPSPAGLVYPNFKKEKNIKSYREMLEIFLEEEIKTDREITLEDLVTIFEGHGLTAVMGVDFGYTDPYVAELMYIDDRDNIYLVREYAITLMDGAEVALHLRDNWLAKHKIEWVYPDIESPANIKLLRKAGFNCAGAKKDEESGVTRFVNKDIKGGIETMRRFIKVPGTSQTKFFAHSSCKLFLEEVDKYHYKTDRYNNVISDNPEDESNHACVSGETLIETTLGRIAIKDLAGKEGEVFCYNFSKNKIGVGKFWNVRKTGRKETYTITLDDGNSLRATGDHLFLKRDCSYERVDSLRSEESLMPLYLSRDKSGRGKVQLNNGESDSTYRLVWRELEGEIEEGEDIHHKDENPSNDSLKNLEKMTHKKHTQLHKENKNVTEDQKNKIKETFKKKRGDESWLSNSRDRMSHAREFASEWHRSEEGKGYHKENIKGATTQEYRDLIKDREVEGKCSCCGGVFRYKTSGAIGRIAKCCSNECYDILREKRRETKKKRCIICGEEFSCKENNNKTTCSKKCSTKKAWLLRKKVFNHKIVSVKYYGYEDVYDMTVEEHHNYNANGVIVHNCDAVRYPIHSIYGGKEGLVELEIDKERDLSKPLMSAPTAGEIAMQIGINLNDNEEEYEELKKKAEAKNIVKEHLGVPLKKKEDDDEDSDDDGFSFAF